MKLANAYIAGGKYWEGSAAQEENMFRRTDCQCSVTTGELGQFDQAGDAYHASFSDLLNAELREANRGTCKTPRVYLDKTSRVCIRGGENTDNKTKDQDIGYKWLAKEHIFPFYELRAAAIDRRLPDRTLLPFDDEMRKRTRQRIEAQLHTLRAENVKHVVLSAFGCGVFENPAAEIAAWYRSVISEVWKDFDVIAFAIFAPGYGPDNNFEVFQRVFEEA